MHFKTKSRFAAALFGALVVSCLTAPAAAQINASFPIPILNGQPSSSGVGFQQEIIFNPSQYAQFEAGDLGNILFCADSACATPLNAWLEGCSGAACTPSATSAIAWVKLTSAVPANGSTIIYLAFQNTSVEFNGTTWGEAPQWTVPYGLYDNGSSVFAEYGGGGAAGWSAFTFLNGTWTTSTGPLQQTSTTTSVDLDGGPAAILTGLSLPATGSYVLETAFENTGTTATARVGIVAVSSITTGPDLYGYRFLGQQNANGAGYLSFLNDEVTWVVNNTYTGSVNTPYTMQITDNAGVWSGSLFAGYQTSGTPLTTLANTAYTTANLQGNATGYVGVSAGWYTSTLQAPNNVVIGNPATFQWFRLRSVPPGDVEPSALLPTLCDTVVLKNPSASLATPAIYQQPLTFYPTTYATLERSDLGNIVYCADDQCATPLNAWLGGCAGSGAGACSPAASSATVWVKLTNSIPAGGSTTIYQCFISTSVSFVSPYWGESIDLGAGGDNGANVFTYYNNGQTVANLTATTGATLATANVANPYGNTTNVISLTARNGAGTSNESVAWATGTVAGDNMIIEGWVNRNANQSAMFAARGGSSAATWLTNYLLGAGWGGAADATLALESGAGNTLLSSNGAYPAAGWLWSYGVISGSVLTDAIYNKQPELGGVQAATTTVSNVALTSTNTIVGVADKALSGANAARFYAWRVRVYFPGGVLTSSIDTTAPAAVANLAAAPIATSSASLSWTAPADANVPSLYSSISEYAIQYSSLTSGVVWSTANAQILIDTSGVSAGAAQGAFVTGLQTNTTYFFYLWSQDPSLNWSGLSNGATTVTLANPVNAATGAPISISASSVTVKWAALPPSPQKSTCEGYELDVSTTNFASGTVYSSTTFSELASTLAVAGLNTGTTMYFRVATLNWTGALNYVFLSSANIQISPSIATIVMGLNSLVAVSTISVSSIVVTNVGNLPVTLVVSGSTITAGSPWVLSVSSGVEQPVLQGEWNAAQPTISTFATSITNSPLVSGAAGGNYAGGESGKAIPSGGSVTMWFQFWAPTSTTAGNTTEAIQVLYQSVYP